MKKLWKKFRLTCIRFLGGKVMAVVSIEIPDEMIEFVMPSNKDEQLKINAMI